MGPTPHLATAASEPSVTAPDSLLAILQPLFKMAYTAYYTAQVSHWHVVGPDFQEYHDYFGAEYEYWADKIDVIAEHIRTHKALLPCCLVELAKGTPSNAAVQDPASLVRRYRGYLRVVLRLVDRLAVAAESTRAHADIDLAGELAREVKKSIWKVESMLA